ANIRTTKTTQACSYSCGFAIGHIEGSISYSRKRFARCCWCASRNARATCNCASCGHQPEKTQRRNSEGGIVPVVMPSQPTNFITAIDVGSAKTCVLVAEISDNGLRYRGHGIAESRGLRKGVITELDKAVSSIQKAVEKAEDVAGIPVEHALVGVAGAH